MSTAALLLQLLIGFLGFLLSFTGIFAGLLGVLLFIVLPVVSKLTGIKRFANFPLWLAMTILGRVAIVVSEHGDILLKRMTFDDLGVEKINFGDDDKAFEDPANALHHWMDVPFALADEKHGVLFDPRHAALGQRKKDYDERGETSIRATQAEWKRFGVHEWKRGVYEMPRKFELVTLGAVRHLVDGGERAEFPKRVEELYKHSRAPFADGTSAVRFITIIVALLAPFGMMWFIASQGSSAGSTVSYSLAVLPISLASIREVLDEVDWRRAGAVFAVVVTPLLAFFGLFALAGPLTAIYTFVTLGMGFWSVPLLAFLSKPSKRLSGGLARLLVKLGLLGYDRPTFVWTPESYRLREFDELDDVERTKWYGLQGSLVGFTFEPSPDSWGGEVVARDEIESRREAVTDGGQTDGGITTNLPSNTARAPSITRGSSYAAFVPKRLEENSYLLNTGIAFGRFRDSADGAKTLSRLTKAKEVHGNSQGLSDKAYLYATLGCGLFSFVAGLGVFFFL